MKAKTVLALIDLRIRDNQKDFDAAMERREFSKLPGLHGIGTGLLMARRLVDDELRWNARSPSTGRMNEAA